MVGINLKSFRLLLPTLADVLIRRQPLKSLKSFGKVIGSKELDEMLLELLMRFIVMALDGRVLDGAIHPLDLSVSPWMIDLGQPMLNAFHK